MTQIEEYKAILTSYFLSFFRSSWRKCSSSCWQYSWFRCGTSVSVGTPSSLAGATVSTPYGTPLVSLMTVSWLSHDCLMIANDWIPFLQSISSNQFLAINFQQLVWSINFKQSITSNQFQAINFQQSNSSNQLPAINCQQSISSNQFQAINFQQSLFSNQSPPINFQQSISSITFLAINFQQSISSNKFQATNFQHSLSSNLFPAINF